MNKDAIKWLYQELPELVAKDILTQETSDKIQQYYGEIKAANKTPFLLIICGVIGAILIGLGIILLFAHNWEQLSRFTRTILSLLPLIIGQGFVLWVLCKKSQSIAFNEGAATFLSLMVGASIALICQTYHIPGDTGDFIFTWMFLIVPLVYLLQASIPAAIYLIGITAWSCSYWDSPVKTVLFWPLAAIVIPHFIWALHQEICTIRTAIISLVMAICVCFGAGFSLGRAWPCSWIIIFSSICAIFYSIGHLKFSKLNSNWQGPWRLIGAVGLFILTFLFTFQDVWKSYDTHTEIFGINALPDNIITFAIIVTAILFFCNNIRRKDLTDSLFGVVPLLAIVSYLFQAQMNVFQEEIIIFPLVIFNIYLFVLSISRIMIGIRNNHLSTVNIGMLILAILIIARFFDSEIDFILKGLTFIAVGVGFLITNVWFIRRRGNVI